MKIFSLRLTDDIIVALQQRAAAEGRPTSNYVRRLLQRAVEDEAPAA